MILFENLLWFFWGGGSFFCWSNDFLSNVVYLLYCWPQRRQQEKEPRMESWECRSSNRPHLSLKLPLISRWLMTHSAVMAPRALHIHSLSSSSRTPGERPQQCELSRHPKLRSCRTRIQTLIKKDVSSIAIQLCIATGSGWTETIEHRRDGKVGKKAFTVQFICAGIKNGFISV